MVIRSSRAILPLENGDRLSRYEFERRYAVMPPQKKAELIEGMVYMAAAVRASSHGNPHGLIISWLGVYHAATPGTYLADNATVRLDLDNEPQPDALLRLESELGGRSRISEDDYIEGAPELIVEIAASSASYDLYEKLKIYQRNGVKEYLVWQVYENKLVWYRLTEGRYVEVMPDGEGIIYSEVFPGLSLDVLALLNRDLAAVLVQLQRSIGSAEHQHFLERIHS